jgi:DNA-binding NarL/FixJ family response regulator
MIQPTRRLLYVDDDESLRCLVKRFFEKKYPTFEVILAGSSSEALEELERRRNTPEFPTAIVTDFHLGLYENGAALVADVRSRFPEVRRVVVSAVEVPDEVRRAASAGAQAFVEKRMLGHFVERLFDLTQRSTNLLPPLGQ